MISNIKNNSVNSFGFSENRVIFEGLGSQPEGVQTRIKDIVTDQPSPIEREKAMKDAEKKANDNKAEIQKKATECKKNFGSKIIINLFAPEEYKKAIDKFTPDFDKPENTIGEIDSILNSSVTINKVKYTLKDAPGMSDIIVALKEIQKLCTERIKLLSAYSEAKNRYSEIHEGALIAKSHRVEEMAEIMTAFDKNQNYTKLESDYSAVFGRLILKDTEFKRFYERADKQGEVDPQRERENKQLFFSILAKETNNFSTSSLFPKMTDDVEENKKNYPYIYIEWIKAKDAHPEKIETAKSDAQKKAKEAGLNSTDELEGKLADIVTDINAIPAGSPKLPNKNLVRNPLDGLPKAKDKKYYEQLENNLSELNTDLHESINLYKNDPKTKNIAERLREIQNKELPKIIDIAKAQRQYEFLLEEQSNFDKTFTRAELDREENRQIAMELAMKQYAKAMDVVDNPFHDISDKKNKDDINWQEHYHPAVRRMMIAMIYREGVAKDANPANNNNEVKDQYRWMLKNVAQSKYFNNETRDKYLDPEQREFLIIARLANVADYKIHLMESKIIPQIQQLSESIKKDIAERDKVTGDAKDKIQARITANITTLDTLTSYKPVDEKTYSTILGIEQQRMKNWRAFVAETETLMKNPDRVAIRAYIEKLKKNETLNNDLEESKKYIDELSNYLKDTDLTYNTLDLKERGTGQYLERMGIHAEGVYQAYLNYFKTHPDIKIDQWGFLLRTKEGTDKLTAMFKVILPDSNIFKGRENFLAVFSTLNDKGVGQSPEMRDGQAVAMNIFHLLKMEMTHREQVGAATLAGNNVALQKLQGMTFGDKITDTFRGVKDMLLGPGQSPANRIAGAVLLILAFKAAKSAYKGDTPMGKLLRLAFVGGSIELALKHMYGEGLTDKLRLSGLADALGGTYESVLLDRGKKKEINITETEHATALMELRNAPFDKVMEWYKSTKPDGSPMPGKMVKIPSPIDIYNIVPGRMDEEKERKAGVILKKTIENFFGYVANKDEKSDSAYGQGILEEIWVKSIKDPKYKLEDSRFTRRNLPSELIKSLRENPSSITWQMVMQAEIRPEDVTKVTKKGVLESAKDIMVSSAAGIERWSRRDLEHPASVKIANALKEIDTYYGPKVKEFVLDMGDNLATGLNVTERKIELWYGENKVEIRRFAGDVCEILYEGVTLPLSILYGTTEWAVTGAAQKIRQLKEIISSNQFQSISHDLNREDIMKDNAYTNFENSINNPKSKFDVLNPNINPGVKFFGLYQTPFYKAISNKNKVKNGWFYESKEQTMQEDGSPHIGFYVSETSEDDAKSEVRPNDSVENKYKAMGARAREQAIAFFESQDIPLDMIKKYMYPIHAIYKNKGNDAEAPYKVYTFWRMPMKNSTEYLMKERKAWADYYNPNKIKDRPPFMVKENLGILDNLKLAFGTDSPALKRGGEYAVLAASQWLRLMMGTVEVGGKIVGGVGRMFLSDKSKMNWAAEITQIDEKTLQKIDEWLGSAENSSLALSEFYKNDNNAKMYKRAIEYVRANPGAQLNLESAPNDGGDKKWEWQKVNVATGKVTPAGQDEYRDSKGGTGRLNADDYTDPNRINGTPVQLKEKLASAPRISAKKRRRGRRQGKK